MSKAPTHTRAGPPQGDCPCDHPGSVLIAAPLMEVCDE